MAINSLVGLAAATLILLVIAIYANTHRAEDQRKGCKNGD
jgi:hypothetical protein